jgi:hypothetical protein
MKFWEFIVVYIIRLVIIPWNSINFFPLNVRLGLVGRMKNYKKNNCFSSCKIVYKEVWESRSHAVPVM